MERNRARTLAVVATLLLISPLAAQAQDAGMVSALVEQLGVTEAQAKGGVQALLATAKGNLSADDFASLLQSAPDFGALAAVTADEGGAADMMRKAESMAEGATEEADEAGEAAEEASSEMEGAMGSVGSALGGAMGDLDLSSLSKLTDLSKSFESLGLDAGMVQKFVPVVLEQLGSSEGAAGLLKKGLGLVS